MSTPPPPPALVTYLAVWNEPDAARRQELLDQCVSDGVVFADPRDYHEGRDALAHNVTRLRRAMPDLQFSRTSGVDGQNDRYRYTWRITRGDEVLMDGFDVSTLDSDGRIERIDGFFGPLPPLED